MSGSSDTTVSRTVVIPLGVDLHARPAGELVRAAAAHDTRIVLRSNGREADAASILQVLALGATAGTPGLSRRAARRRPRPSTRSPRCSPRSPDAASSSAAPAICATVLGRRRPRAPLPAPRVRARASDERTIRRVLGEAGRGDAQLVDSEPDQQRQDLGVTRRLAADVDRDACGVGGRHGARDQAHDRRVIRQRRGRRRRILTIGCERVLDQVVRPDREEVAASRDRRRR